MRFGSNKKTEAVQLDEVEENNEVTPSKEVPVVKAPLEAVRKHCLNCMDNSYKRVENCEVKDCPVWHLRIGINPFRKKKVLTEEQKRDIAERLKNARVKKAKG